MVWYKRFLDIFEKPIESISSDIIENISIKVKSVQCDAPVVSVIIIAHNEETRLLSCVWSLAENITEFPFEIIGIDNNSDDSTLSLFKRLGVKSYSEERKGPGYARQKGLDMAKGEYCLCIDSDTLYPPSYIQKMVLALKKTNVVVVSSTYNYVPDKNFPRFWMGIYEFVRDVHLFFLSFKNPVWCVRGAVMGHKTLLAREVGGYREYLMRGEDGALAYDMYQFGKIVFIRGYKARAYTSTKALSADGHILRAFYNRFVDSLKGFRRYLFFTGDSDPRPSDNK